MSLKLGFFDKVLFDAPFNFFLNLKCSILFSKKNVCEKNNNFY